MKTSLQSRLYNKWQARFKPASMPRPYAIIGQKQPTGSGKAKCPSAIDYARQSGFLTE